MGVLDRFERGVERAVNGAFAKAFRSEVEPVELASALRRETDNSAAVVARDRTLVPNSFTITLGTQDNRRIADWRDSLAEELAESVTAHARQQRYAFVGPVTVRFDQDDHLDTGVFRVTSARTKGRIAPASDAVATVDHPVLDVDGHPYQLTRTTTVIGRGADADVVVDDAGVSRRHVRITLEPGGAVAKDLGSTNGTVVDGERAGSARLGDGSVITIGRTRIVFHTGSGRARSDDEDS